MRNNPLYHAGAVAFSVSAGIPKVGVLLESVWNMNDSCRFQLRSPESLKNMEKTTKTQEIKSVFLSLNVEASSSVASNTGCKECLCLHPGRMESKPELVKTEMGPPPSPASTCSDTSSIASSASLPYSMLLSELSCLPGTGPVPSSLWTLISALTLKQMEHRLLSAPPSLPANPDIRYSMRSVC